MSNQPESSTTSFWGESRNRKRRKLSKPVVDDRTATWRSDSHQRIYSTKLLDALRHIRPSSATTNPLDVRAAADRVLAATAKGRTRWSRAILKHNRRRCLHLKKVSRKNPNHKLAIGGESRRRSAEKVVVPAPAVETRVKVLGRLVPGCRKLSFPSLLEETTDYIAALEMQVRAMATLAQLLTSAGSSLTSGR